MVMVVEIMVVKVVVSTMVKLGGKGGGQNGDVEDISEDSAMAVAE